MRKILQTADMLIQKMLAKNIRFDIYSEEEAIAFLSNNSYYKKVTSYQNNFSTFMKEGKKQYSDLDFAYLVELSTLDMEFRFLVMKMCLNFEHALKVLVIEKCLAEREDGYSIIDEYFTEKPEARKEIIKHANNSYCKDLILANQEEMPVWTFLEVTSFGGLCHFCKFLSSKQYFKPWEVDIFFKVRDFRNAAAHSHCLFSQLKRTEREKAIYKVKNYVMRLDVCTKTEKNNSLKSKCVNDFVTLLYAFECYVKSQGIIRHTKEDINELFNVRMLRNKEYFSNCMTVKNSYKFAKKILDKWCKET